MTIWAALLLAATSAYLGFQLTIRMLVYPQFAAVPAEAWVGYERRHQQRVTRLVGPLFVLDGAATIAAFAARPHPTSAVAGIALAAVLALTGLGAVPQHTALGADFDERAFRRLLRIDTLRVGAAGVAVAAAIGYALV